MREAAGRALVHPRHRGFAALAALAMFAASGYAAAMPLRPPTARPAAAAAAEFSATRAFQHVRTIAARPHPAGSAANDAVRQYLVATLRGLHLTPSVQDTVSVQSGKLSASDGGIGVARVRNVVTRLPGTAPTGRISWSRTTTRCRSGRAATMTPRASRRVGPSALGVPVLSRTASTLQWNVVRSPVGVRQ
jgi:hypothetical protein